MTTGPAPRTWSSAAGSGGGALLQRVKDEVRPRHLERRRGVGPLDDPVGPDHHQRATGHAVLVRPDSVRLRDLPFWVEVREQRDLGVEVLLESLVAEGAVDRDAEQSRAPLLELREYLLVDAQLVGADRAEVGRVEDQYHRPPAEVGERDLVAILIGKPEIRRRRTGLDHRRRPSSWMSDR